jgi:hypothetical protein
LEGDFEPELKNGMTFIHHGPARQDMARGERMSRDHIKQQSSAGLVKRRECGVQGRCMCM